MGTRSKPLDSAQGQSERPRRAGRAPGIQTRLALSFGLTILVTGLAVVAALWVVVGASLLGRPPALTVVPSAVILHVFEPGPPGQHDEPMATDALGLEIAPYSLRSFAPRDFDRLWVDAAGRRLAALSGFAGLVVVLVAASSGYLLSRRVSAPLSDFAETVQDLSSFSLDRRVPDPGTDDELGQLAASFNAMLDRLEASFRDLEDATSYVSHELRTALSVVRTQLEVGLAGSRDLGLAARQALASAVRASDMVDDALALASRSVPGTDEPVDLALVAAQAVDDYSRPERQLVLEIPSDGVPPVRGNSTWLYRAVANLLDNAFKYGPELGPVTVRVVPRFDAVVLSVEDRGPGIASQDVKRIWERFYRGRIQRSEGAEAGRGYGLGLALVRQAVESAGGAVWVESDADRGSVFFLSVPRL